MNIALIAHDAKKEMMIQLCIAYKKILSNHNLYATAKTGKLVSDATGLEVIKFLSGDQGGDQQNMATAEVLIHGLDRGDLDWREILKTQK